MKLVGAARASVRLSRRRRAGKPPSNWQQGSAVLCARDRETVRHVERIVARVLELHPRDPAAQRRALRRWSGILRACDPGVAEALLDVPVTAGRKVA